MALAEPLEMVRIAVLGAQLFRVEAAGWASAQFLAQPTADRFKGGRPAPVVSARVHPQVS